MGEIRVVACEINQCAGPQYGTEKSRSDHQVSKVEAVPEAYRLIAQAQSTPTDKPAASPADKPSENEKPCTLDEQLVVVFQDGMNSKGDPLASSSFKAAVETQLETQNMGHEKKNLKILDSPYPRFNEGCDPIDNEQRGIRGFWSRLKTRAKNAFRYVKNVYQNVKLYLDYQNPYSKASDKAYAAFKDSLDLKPGDRKSVIINGHSGAGALASVYSRRLKDEADALRAQGIEVKVIKVITHGSPYLQNHTPPEVELYNCDAASDGVQNTVCLIPGICRTAPNRDSNDRTIRFGRIGHREYYGNPEVLDFVSQSILSEFQKRQPKPQPAKPPSVGDLPMPGKTNQTDKISAALKTAGLPMFVYPWQQSTLA